MNEMEKLNCIADSLEVEVEELAREKELSDFETWDSVAILSIIAFFNDKLGKYPSSRDIAKCKTVGELLDAMN